MKPLLVLFVAVALALPALAQTQPERDPGFRAITQVALVTKDIEASARHWAALLGVETCRIW